MSLVCLDNNILIWGIRGVATLGQEHLIPRARLLLDQLEQEKAQIMVPAPVLAEFLAGVPEHMHADLLQVFQRRFIVMPFDSLAAFRSAQIFRQNAARNPNWQADLRHEFPDASRVRIKFDLQILSIALVQHAERLYTHDGPLQSMAQGRIQVLGLPEYFQQTQFPIAEL